MKKLPICFLRRYHKGLPLSMYALHGGGGREKAGYCGQGGVSRPVRTSTFYPVLNAYIAGSELQYSLKIIWFRYLDNSDIGITLFLH